MFSTMEFFSGIALGVVLGIFLKTRKMKQDEVKDEFSSEAEGVDGDTKLVLVVRSDLKMGKGKVASQCAHAAIKAFEQATTKKSKTLNSWKRNGQPKIVVKCDSEEEMKQLAHRSRELSLITSMIQDAGRTQIAPGSRTVLGIGPGPSSEIQKVTGHLKLF